MAVAMVVAVDTAAAITTTWKLGAVLSHYAQHELQYEMMSQD